MHADIEIFTACYVMSKLILVIKIRIKESALTLGQVIKEGGIVLKITLLKLLTPCTYCYSIKFDMEITNVFIYFSGIACS